MWGIVDCDNFFCSCERVFRPDLRNKALVVLSNNDGCVVARSREAKALGVPMGMPWYQVQQLYAGRDIVAFSSNYALYADLSGRVMSVLRESVPEMYQYSIDECFLRLDGFVPAEGLKKWGEELAVKIERWVGIPVSIGIAGTKTLAKVAVRYAKKYKGYHKCAVIEDDRQRYIALRGIELEDVWGIGRRMGRWLKAQGKVTAADVADMPREIIRYRYGVTGERTWQELHGKDVKDVENFDEPRKSIMTGRSFPVMLTEFDDVRTHVANFAARCAAKLRRQNSVCSMITVFVDSNHFREDLEQYHAQSSWLFTTPVNDSSALVEGAAECLSSCFRKGIRYKRAAAMVSGLSTANAIQPDLFVFDAEQTEKLRTLGVVLDDINRREGADTVVLASQQYAVRDDAGKSVKYVNAIRRTLKSPDYSIKPDDFKVH